VSNAVLRLGIFGGTFDPPHLGHLLLAEIAADALGLAQVLFVPAADPPHKDSEQVTAAVHRVAMVQLAIAGNPRFVLSRTDLDRPGPHYTVDMLALQQAQYPNAALIFLMGGDALRDFARWHDPAGILRQARLGVVQRPGVLPNIAALEAVLPDIARCISTIDAPEIGLSATGVRARLRAGRSIRYQVPADVEQYIHTHGLYVG
jgi:nicotinate-nucleotide adenylyltransferase